MNSPCSACITKGRSCVFLNDPATSKRRKAKTATTSVHGAQSQISSDLEPLFHSGASDFEHPPGSYDGLDLALSTGRPLNDIPGQSTVPLALVPSPSSRYPIMYDSWSLSAQQQHLGNPNSSGVFGAMWEWMQLPSLTPDVFDENMLNTIPSPTSEELDEYRKSYVSGPVNIV